MATTYNYVWPQGEDLSIQIIYKTGVAGSETPQDLTGYSLRMDIVSSLTGIRRYTFNSAAIADVDPITTGSQADNNMEAVLGTDGSINITVPRSLTLPPAGELYADISASDPMLVFNYDIFLRDPSNHQKKILSGTITIEKSYTLWP